MDLADLGMITSAFLKFSIFATGCLDSSFCLYFFMKIFIIALLVFEIMTSCNSYEMKVPVSGNPLLNEYNTPFQVPPFDLINDKDYIPAFKEGIKRQEDEIKQIIENKEKPTFDNTIAAFDYSGRLLSEVSSVFYSLTGANTNDSLQNIQKEITPLLTRHSDNLIMNAGLFNRIKAVYESPAKSGLTPEQTMLLVKTYKRFVRNGAGLDAEKQKRLREVNEQMASLSVKFGNNLLKETKAFKLVIDKEEDLAGLPASVKDAAADEASKAKENGKWVFTLDNASVMSFLTYADNRVLREKMLKAYAHRGNNNNGEDNKEIMSQLINLRAEKANLLGYKNYAALRLEERMAKTPEKAIELLDKLWEPALKVAAEELDEYQAYIAKEGGKFKLESWDWRYYAEKVRKEKYDLDEEQIRPYFALENVRQGAFMVANKLFGLSFNEIKNIPRYHPDNVVYEVKDKDGAHLGVLYMDFHPRESKRGGAWCGSFREQYKQNGKNISPVVTIVCNFSKPAAEAPALLNFDEANTLFHEFGHALQALLSKVTYPGVGDLVRDYVELPSQVLENWASDPEVINLYAKHYKTGKPIPAELLDKMMKSRLFNEGFATVEYLAASFLDMDYHTIAAPVKDLDVVSFEEKSMRSRGLMPQILPRYRTTYFNHISSEGYAAGYYVYIWAAVLDADAFEAFKEKGIFDQKTAQLFRENVLEKGGSEDEMEAYKRFRGSEPSITPLLRRRGLL
jgi:peptidyl-dipeptidase Dcp